MLVQNIVLVGKLDCFCFRGPSTSNKLRGLPRGRRLTRRRQSHWGVELEPARMSFFAAKFADILCQYLFVLPLHSYRGLAFLG